MKNKQILLSFALCLYLPSCVVNKSNSINKSPKQPPQSISTYVTSEFANSNGTNATIITNTDTAIEFKRTLSGNMVCTYPSGKCRTDKDEYSGGASLYGDIPGSSGSFIHSMKFKLYSKGYFAKNPDGHFAMGLRGQYLSYEKFKEKAGHDGKGIIFGSIGYGYPPNKNNPSCVTKMIQAESWFKSYQLLNNSSSANNIFPTTCSDSILEDYNLYTIEIEVTSHHYIIYKVYNSNGILIHHNYYNDLPNYKDPNLTGWFIGHVFENQTAEWSLRMEDFQVGHIKNSDVLYPIKSFSSSIYFTNNDKIISRENINNFSTIIYKNQLANIKLNNVTNRKRVWSCANFRKIKTDSDSVDCNNWQNYREIKLTVDPDWIYQGDKLILRADYLKSLPSQYYTVYFRLNPQDELSQSLLSFELR